MSDEKRIVFMGTPEFAVPALAALVEAGPTGGWRVVAAVTQPDRRAGRGKRLVASPVKAYARSQGIAVLQPSGLRKQPAAVEELADLEADLFAVAAYGLILPKTVLELPRFGCINIHASLLPAYRGASPIAAAILDGQMETGVTLMLMDEGMDTGPSLQQVREPIAPLDTTQSLSARLAQAGGQALVDLLPDWFTGEIAPVDQAELPGEPSICRMIKKEDGRIDWSRPAAYIERMTRAYVPWPSAYTSWQRENFKIVQAGAAAGEGEAGVVYLRAGECVVGTGDGMLRLLQVQPAGKRAMEIDSFLNGAPDFVGSRLGAQ